MRPVSEQKNYELAIFDFDGTLLDTSLIYPFIHKELLRDIGVPDDELAYIASEYWLSEVAMKAEHIDVPAYLCKRHSIDASPLDFRITRNQIEREYFSGKRRIKELAPLERYVIKPVMNDLHRLHENGARCFIVSHNYGTVIESAMRSLSIEQIFEDCYCHCAWEALKHPTYDRNESKKNTFAHLAHLASIPEKCVVYDDFDEHIQSAIELGIDAVKVDSEHAYPKGSGEIITC